jgi:AraC-like DNA-binding protein
VKPLVLAEQPSNSMHPANSLPSANDGKSPGSRRRFRQFRKAVELEFKRWHLVTQYAKHIGCSQKELHQVTLSETGLSAKAFLMGRIVVEAERLLSTTALSVAAISDELGFHEATYFVKFFRRSAGITPGQYRLQRGPN